MKAEIVSIGTELLMGQIVDTNAPEAGRLFGSLGISCTHRQTVGDNLDRITEALRLALGRADVVLTIGGLGPTEDDLTRDAIAAALDDELVLDPAIESSLRNLFASRRLPWVSSQSRQATRPSCAEVISNPNGTAPGLVARKSGKVVLALPGPSNEFLPMLYGPVTEILRGLGTGSVIESTILRVIGVGESVIEKKIASLIHGTNPTVAPYAKTGEVHLRITASASDSAKAQAMISPVEAEIRSALGDAVYGRNAETLEEVVLQLFRTRGWTLAVAESCTGGGLGARLTDVAGSSDVFKGGWITYSNQLKQDQLGVPSDTLESWGAVSAECAESMAEGARLRSGATVSAAITGVAGPGGGTAEKPVGLVFVGYSIEGVVSSEKFQFGGIRSAVRRRATQAALAGLRRLAMARTS